MSSTTPGRAGIPHLPALDGLRGIALLAVLLFHANGALPGGYLGVDLFFVLSGFLITSLLLAERRQTGRISLSAFWVRRARRLFPALLSLMPAVAIYGRYFARPDELEALRTQTLATLAYVANWNAIFAQRSYWQLFAAPSPLEHTWSLSIEEQFYLLWPLLVVLLLRRGTERSVRVLAIALSVLSMGAMLLLFKPENTTRAYMGTDTRMAGILCGAALATFLVPGRSFSRGAARSLDALGLASVFGLGLAWCKLEGTHSFLYHGGFWLAELGALVLIGCAVMGDQSLVARALSFRPFRWLGTLSYGAYLWHWPINVLLTPERTGLHGAGLYAARFALTFAIAALSYRFLERPILNNGVPFGRPQYIVPASVLLSAFLVVRATHAREQQIVSSAQAMAAIASAAPPPERVRYRVLFFGDSTANSLGWGLRGLREPGVAVDLLGKDGCTMLHDACNGEHWARQVRERRPDVSLVYLAGAFLHGFHVKGDWNTACRPEWDLKFEGILTRRLRELTAEQGRVFALTAPYPVGRWDTEQFREQVDCVNASIRKAVAAAPGARLLDVAAKLCPSGGCQLDAAGVGPLRPDGVHFSIGGARALSRWIFEQIRH